MRAAGVSAGRTRTHPPAWRLPGCSEQQWSAHPCRASGTRHWVPLEGAQPCRWHPCPGSQQSRAPWPDTPAPTPAPSSHSCWESSNHATAQLRKGTSCSGHVPRSVRRPKCQGPRALRTAGNARWGSHRSHSAVLVRGLAAPKHLPARVFAQGRGRTDAPGPPDPTTH